MIAWKSDQWNGWNLLSCQRGCRNFRHFILHLSQSDKSEANESHESLASNCNFCSPCFDAIGRVGFPKARLTSNSILRRIRAAWGNMRLASTLLVEIYHLEAHHPFGNLGKVSRPVLVLASLHVHWSIYNPQNVHRQPKKWSSEWTSLVAM